jgi:hypothetical protein
VFKKVIRALEKLVNKTQDLTVLTDGERRYGNTLFGICFEIVKSGKRGRPKKTLKKGVKARVKNKGSQSFTKKDPSDLNIKVPGLNILKPGKSLKIKTSMPIMLKPSLVHCAEDVRLSEEELTCMLNSPLHCAELCMFTG